MTLLILQIVLEGLKTFNLIYGDQPVEVRQKAWQDWAAFVSPIWAGIAQQVEKK